MRRLGVAAALAGILALAAFSTVYAGRPSSAPRQATFSATWASQALCTGVSYATPCSATAVATWQDARMVRAVQFDFDCQADSVGVCAGGQPTSVTLSVPSTSNGSTAVTFTWSDDCADPGYSFRATFLDSKGRAVFERGSEYIRNPYCS